MQYLTYYFLINRFLDYFNLSSVNATKFRQALLTKTLIWQEEARAAGLSNGTFVEAGEGKALERGRYF